MANGELVFASPWESRVFGMARTLCEQGHYSWDEFRERLIQQISAWEQTHRSDHAEYDYYHCFLAALESLLAEKSLCVSEEVDQREAEYAARPHGHDH